MSSALHLLLPCHGLAAVVGGLGQPGRAGQHAAGSEVDVEQLDAVIGEEELADLVGVRHAARLEDVEAAVALAAQLEVLSNSQVSISEEMPTSVRSRALPPLSGW